MMLTGPITSGITADAPEFMQGGPKPMGGYAQRAPTFGGIQGQAPMQLTPDIMTNIRNNSPYNGLGALGGGFGGGMGPSMGDLGGLGASDANLGSIADIFRQPPQQLMMKPTPQNNPGGMTGSPTPLPGTRGIDRLGNPDGMRQRLARASLRRRWPGG